MCDEAASSVSQFCAGIRKACFSLPTPGDTLTARYWSEFMLWFKTFHVVFMVAWFAVLFMLPRLFVYHLETTDLAMQRKFSEWERRTYILGHVAFGLTLVFGLIVLHLSVQMMPAYLKQGWLHAKFLLVGLLFAYFIYCGKLQKALALGNCSKSTRWMRLFNEVPALFLILIVALVIVRPF
jgi:protoporphyrinogen IX oxidase